MGYSLATDLVLRVELGLGILHVVSHGMLPRSVVAWRRRRRSRRHDLLLMLLAAAQLLAHKKAALLDLRLQASKIDLEKLDPVSDLFLQLLTR